MPEIDECHKYGKNPIYRSNCGEWRCFSTAMGADTEGIRPTAYCAYCMGAWQCANHISAAQETTVAQRVYQLRLSLGKKHPLPIERSTATCFAFDGIHTMSYIMRKKCCACVCVSVPLVLFFGNHKASQQTMPVRTLADRKANRWPEPFARAFFHHRKLRLIQIANVNNGVLVGIAMRNAYLQRINATTQKTMELGSRSMIRNYV